MLLYRTHKKLKKHTFKIKSKRVNRKSNKVRRQQRGGWPGDKKKQIKRQFLVNAILLQSMYNITRDPQIKKHLDYVMRHRDFFMGKTGEIPQNITLQSLDNEKKTYDFFRNNMLKPHIKQKVDDSMVSVNQLIDDSNRDTNSHLRNILTQLEAVSPITTEESQTSDISVQQSPFMVAPYPPLLSRQEGNLLMFNNHTFSLIISIGETCLYVDTEQSKSLLKTKFNDLVDYFFNISNAVLVYKNNAKENSKYNIQSETDKLTGFKYYSGIEEGEGKSITERFRGMRKRILIPSSDRLDITASVNYITELYRLINNPPPPPPPPPP
jgi:Zn-dependent M16 (insulinase) family peptidase